jgi:hypothetical protein
MPCWTPRRLLGCPADYRSEHCLSWGSAYGHLQIDLRTPNKEIRSAAKNPISKVFGTCLGCRRVTCVIAGCRAFWVGMGLSGRGWGVVSDLAGCCLRSGRGCGVSSKSALLTRISRWPSRSPRSPADRSAPASEHGIDVIARRAVSGGRPWRYQPGKCPWPAAVLGRAGRRHGNPVGASPGLARQ